MRLCNALEDISGAFIAGGAVLSHTIGSEINDYDLYPKSKEDAIAACKHLATLGQIVSITDYAATFLLYKKYGNDKRIPVQVIWLHYTKDIKEIFNWFDFSVCMGAYDLDSREFIYGEHFWEDVAKRKIRFNTNARTPFTSIFRVYKYEEKGFAVSRSEIAKIAYTINNAEFPKSWQEAKKQIGGVYGRLINIGNDKEFSFEALMDELDRIDIADENTSIDHNKTYSLDDVLDRFDTNPLWFSVNGGNYLKYGDARCKTWNGLPNDDIEVVQEPYLVKSYKYVRPTNNPYAFTATHDHNFTYAEKVIHKPTNGHGLYAGKVQDCQGYSANGKNVLIEVYCLPSDIMSVGTALKAKRLYVSQVNLAPKKVSHMVHPIVMEPVTEENRAIYNTLKVG